MLSKDQKRRHPSCFSSFFLKDFESNRLSRNFETLSGIILPLIFMAPIIALTSDLETSDDENLSIPEPWRARFTSVDDTVLAFLKRKESVP